MLCVACWLWVVVCCSLFDDGCVFLLVVRCSSCGACCLSFDVFLVCTIVLFLAWCLLRAVCCVCDVLLVGVCLLFVFVVACLSFAIYWLLCVGCCDCALLRLLVSVCCVLCVVVCCVWFAAYLLCLLVVVCCLLFTAW